jgi:serralysin
MSTPTTNSVIAEIVAAANDDFIDSLIHRTRWVGDSTVSLSFSFPGASSVWAPSYSELNEPGGSRPFSAAEADAARSALQLWSRYANLTFTETSDNAGNVGDIRFASTTMDDEESGAHAYTPGSAARAGDVWFDAGDFSADTAPGSAFHFVLLHEIGHSLGLKHPFAPTPLSSATLDPTYDTISYTVMSYNLYEDLSLADYALSFYPTTPMPLDIAAMQYLYGARAFNAGDTQYVYNENSDYFETIYDTGGNDTIVWNSNEQFAIIDLLGGAWSSLGNALYTYDGRGNTVFEDIYNVVIYRSSVIENAIAGASDDELYGNEVGNRLDAGGGHDIVWGDAGADTIIGGGGNDHLYGQSPSGGTDSADSISGDDGSDYLQGNAGGDTLDGGNGSDRINGGGADDVIFGSAGNDTVNGNLGADTISGDDGNDSLRGGQGADSIAGGAGDDRISGDLGTDLLSGGAGADLFLFNGLSSPVAQPDRVLDFAIGTDRISIGFTPVAILTGSAQTDSTAAAAAAQQSLDSQAGDREVTVLTIGTDTYLFYAGNGGATVDSAIIFANNNSLSFSLAEFA